MKKHCSIFLILALLLPVLAGCRSTAAPGTTGGSKPLPGHLEEPSDTAAVTGQISPTAAITAAEAEAIALEHAGLTANQVTRLYTEPDRDDGILHYDVEFHYDGYEYDYEIAADTGSILKSEKERD